jgi:hypothetical protein
MDDWSKDISPVTDLTNPESAVSDEAARKRAREFDDALYASLDCRAQSEQSRALVNTVARLVRHATHEHDVGHGLKHAEAVDPARHPHGQGFASELIDQRHQPELAAIVGQGLHEVVGPDMIAPFNI